MLCSEVMVRVFFESFSFFLLVVHVSKAYVSDKGALQAAVQESNRARVKPNSRSTYANSAVRFLQWLSVNYPEVVNVGWVNSVLALEKLPQVEGPVTLDDEFKEAMKKRLLNFDVGVPPLVFAAFQTNMEAAP